MFKEKLSKIFIFSVITVIALQLLGVFILQLVPRPTQANGEEFKPSQNCWTQSACQAIDRAEYKEAPGECPAGKGKCYAPPPIVPLSVPFPEFGEGGKLTGVPEGTVSGISGYISFVYTWLIRVIAILAVVMITMAGLNWMMAAGNATMISKAKSQMLNAIVGLVLVLGSYMILYIINPALVNFKGIRIELVPTIEQSTFWCKDMKEEVTLTKVSDSYKAEGADEYVPFGPVLPRGEEEGLGGCGVEYKIGEGKGTCIGNKCEANKVCLQEGEDEFTCKACKIYGNVQGDLENMKVKEIKLYQICDSGEFYMLSDPETFKIIDSQYCFLIPKTGCGWGQGNFKGYVIDICKDKSLRFDRCYAIDKNGNPIRDPEGEVIFADWLATGGVPQDFLNNIELITEAEAKNFYKLDLKLNEDILKSL